MPDTKKPSRELPKVLGELGLEINAAIVRNEANGRSEAGNERLRRRTLLAPALAAATVAVVVALLAFGTHSHLPALTTDEAVAAVAHAATNSEPVGPGQFLYTKSYSLQLRSYGRTIDALGRLVGPTAVIVGRFQIVAQSLKFPTPGDEARAKQQIAAMESRRQSSDAVEARIRALSRKTGLPTNSYPSFLGPEPNAGTFDANGHFQVGGLRLTPEQLEKYPTDPKVIYRRLHKRIALGNAKYVARIVAKGRPKPQTINPDIGVWDAVTEPMLWFNLPLPPHIRANFVRALGTIPGVTSAPNEKDPRGRPGIALTLDLQGVRRVAIFDPKTGALLSLKSVLTNPKLASTFNHQEDLARLPAGTVQREYLLLEESVVSKFPNVRNPDGPVSRFRQEF
jgi:hypothetical protein